MVEAPPAFPQNDWSFAGGDGREGMTLRDWFAGQALAGIQTLECIGWTHKELAQHCYSLADAMLAERSK